MSPRRRRLLWVAGIGSAVAVGVLLVVLYIPISQESTGYTLIGLRLYSFESVSLFGSSWWNLTYRGVGFTFHLWCAISTGGGTICGNASDPSGAVYAYSFFDGLYSHWTTWVAPGGHEAVQYRTGGLAHLLVAT